MILRPLAALVVTSFLVPAASGCGANASSAAVDAGFDAPLVDAGVADVATVSADAADDAPIPDVSCSAYCALMATNCSGTHAQLVSPEQCLALCGDLPLGAFGDADDSIGCREAHAIAAAKDPEQHCAAAGPFGGGLCGDRCDDYCTIMLSLCSGADSQYMSKPSCWNECMNRFAFDADAGEYTHAGNTLNCREGFLESIGLGDAGDHAASCAAAGPQSAPCQ